MVKSFLGSDISDLVHKVRDAQLEMSDSISGLRNIIADLKKEIERVRSIPVDLEFAQERVDTWLDDRIAHTRRLMLHLPSAGKWSEPPDPTDFVKSPESWEPKESDMIVTVIALMKPLMAAAIKKQIAAFYKDWDGEVISEDDRAAQLSQLEEKLLDAEISEEAIIRSAKRSGVGVSRRRDADPRAVLAADSALP